MRESIVSEKILLVVSKLGGRLFRNNNTVFKDSRGIPIRSGLANTSKKINKKNKSSDFIGILPITITQAMVGKKVGVFLAIEMKKEGWRYTGTDREKAQKKFIGIIKKHGGKGGFVASVEDLTEIIK